MSVADWSRWMHASVAAYLKNVADGIQLPSLVEGVEDRTKAFMKATDRAEIRVNGPYTKKFSGMHEARIYVNVLVTSNMGQDKNAFSYDTILGAFHAAMDVEIPLFKTGSSADDQTQIGCLKQIDEVKVFRFGQLSSDDRVRQGMVTSAYTYHFER